MGDIDRAAINAEFDRLAGGGLLGLAVSGGGDSVALLSLAIDWARARSAVLHVATVDHGLRAESADEAQGVASLAARLGLSHDVLKWHGGPGHGNLQGNLQAMGRDARLSLLSEWAVGLGLESVALGHTQDDQAETVLMRLARGSGVDGLSGMAASIQRHGVRFIRPLLGVRREALRAYLSGAGLRWIDDPTNDDQRFERIKARALLADPPLTGLNVARLAETADRMTLASAALERWAADLAGAALKPGAFGEIRLDPRPLGDAPREVALRLLASALRRTSGAVYRPRLKSLADLLDAILEGAIGAGRALHGCLIRPDAANCLILREPAQMAPPRSLTASYPWDGRWSLDAPERNPSDCVLGGLGERGLEILKLEQPAPPSSDWLQAPYEVRLTCPAIWRGERLISAPHAGFGAEARVRFTPPSILPGATAQAR